MYVHKYVFMWKSVHDQIISIKSVHFKNYKSKEKAYIYENYSHLYNIIFVLV